MVTLGRNDVEKGLSELPEVWGIVIGAFGEFSSNWEKIIETFADQGALLKGYTSGSSEYFKNRGVIAWWLKRRWSRLAAITTAQCRHDRMAYVGSTAQQQAARQHAERFSSQERER